MIRSRFNLLWLFSFGLLAVLLNGLFLLGSWSLVYTPLVANNGWGKVLFLLGLVLVAGIAMLAVLFREEQMILINTAAKPSGLQALPALRQPILSGNWMAIYW